LETAWTMVCGSVVLCKRKKVLQPFILRGSQDDGARRVLHPSLEGGVAECNEAGWGGVTYEKGSPPPGAPKRADLPPQLKSDLSEFNQYEIPNSGKPELGWGGEEVSPPSLSPYMM